MAAVVEYSSRVGSEMNSNVDVMEFKTRAGRLALGVGIGAAGIGSGRRDQSIRESRSQWAGCIHNVEIGLADQSGSVRCLEAEGILT